MGTVRRIYGALGFVGGAFGAAGWQDDAQVWAMWAEMNPELAGALMGAGGVMFATWVIWEVIRLWRRVWDRELPQPTAYPFINQTFNFNAGTDLRNIAHHLRSEMEGETVRGLRETMRSLTQEPLGNGHTYAQLPEGTNIVSMADGTMRLALPVNISVSISSGVPTVSASLTSVIDEDQ